MKKTDFLADLEDVLQREEAILETDNLSDYEEWDSLSKMAVMAYYDKNFKVKINLETFKNVKTVKDLIKLAGASIDD